MQAFCSNQQLMKRVLYTAVFLLSCFSLFAQSKEEKALAERAYLLSHTVFGNKDSVTTEDLFAKKATYGHSSGKMETREEAVAAIVKNKAYYTDTTMRIENIVVNGDVAIVRTVFKGKQNNPDGNAAPLNLHIMLVWVKEKGKWRLMGRQAVKLT
jgi:ketosteroid isomerase-like protein